MVAAIERIQRRIDRGGRGVGDQSPRATVARYVEPTCIVLTRECDVRRVGTVADSQCAACSGGIRRVVEGQGITELNAAEIELIVGVESSDRPGEIEDVIEFEGSRRIRRECRAGGRCGAKLESRTPTDESIPVSSDCSVDRELAAVGP